MQRCICSDNRETTNDKEQSNILETINKVINYLTKYQGIVSSKIGNVNKIDLAIVYSFLLKYVTYSNAAIIVYCKIGYELPLVSHMSYIFLSNKLMTT